MDEQIRYTVARSRSDDPATVARWLEAGARRMIQTAIDMSVAHPVVDLTVLSNAEVCTATNILAVGKAETHIIDVPVRAVVALTGARMDTPSVGTWRTLFDAIHAVGWETDHLAYFDRKIADAAFMAPGATGELTMTATGSVAYVTNAMHRMIAGACWLGARDGEQARLREVKVYFSPAHPLAREKIVELHAQGYAVALAAHETHVSARPHFRIRARKDAAVRTFTVCGASLVEDVQARRPWPLRSGSPLCADEDWKTLHPRVIAVLDDERWLPEYLRGRCEGSR